MGDEKSVGASLPFYVRRRAVRLLTDFVPDWNAVQAVVDATHRYHEIFYERQ